MGGCWFSLLNHYSISVPVSNLSVKRASAILDIQTTYGQINMPKRGKLIYSHTVVSNASNRFWLLKNMGSNKSDAIIFSI